MDHMINLVGWVGGKVKDSGGAHSSTPSSILLSDLDNEQTRKAFDRPTYPKSEKQHRSDDDPEPPAHGSSPDQRRPEQRHSHSRQRSIEPWSVPVRLVDPGAARDRALR